jgi:hypothetical protein
MIVMAVERIVIVVAAVVFAGTGAAYMLVPASVLPVVAIDPTATSTFLLRTEGVALLTIAGLLLAVRDGAPRQLRVVLAALAFYLIVGSAVDLAAFARGVVGPASVPSAAIRIAIGAVCLVAAVQQPRQT